MRSIVDSFTGVVRVSKSADSEVVAKEVVVKGFILLFAYVLSGNYIQSMPQPSQ